jgi:hypothetical protein
MGNSGDKSLIPVIEEYVTDTEPLVRAHAEWALRKLGSMGSPDALTGRIRETNPIASEESGTNHGDETDELIPPVVKSR